MGDDINWLVTVLYGDTLLQCALQVKRDALPGDCAEYPMEPENRKAIHALLPLHVQTCGPIVAVDELFEVHIANWYLSQAEHRCGETKYIRICNDCAIEIIKIAAGAETEDI